VAEAIANFDPGILPQLLNACRSTKSYISTATGSGSVRHTKGYWPSALLLLLLPLLPLLLFCGWLPLLLWLRGQTR